MNLTDRASRLDAVLCNELLVLTFYSPTHGESMALMQSATIAERSRMMRVKDGEKVQACDLLEATVNW